MLKYFIDKESGNMTKEKEEIRNVPLKNYIILLAIFIGTFLLTYYLYRWYKVYADYQNNIPVIRDSLTEITKEEMEHYIEENTSATIYVCTADNQNCRSFEKNFKKLVDKKALKEYIIYVNITDQDIDKFVSDFNDKYQYKIKLTKDVPAFITFEDGEVTDILEPENDKDKLTMDEVTKYLKVNKIGE